MSGELTPAMDRKVKEVIARVKAAGGDTTQAIVTAMQELPEAFTPVPLPLYASKEAYGSDDEAEYE